MAHEWQALTRLTGGGPLEVERVRCTDTGIAIEGAFELPALARLSAEDQAFVALFVRCHGSIKQMEKFFGVSYPTIKNRLNRISSVLPFVEEAPPPPASADDVISEIERGELSVDEALRRLHSLKENP